VSNSVELFPLKYYAFRLKLIDIIVKVNKKKTVNQTAIYITGNT